MPRFSFKAIYNQAGEVVGYVDTLTGEKLGLPAFKRAQRSPYGKWVMNNQEAAIFIAKDKEIKGETHRVLWFIIGILDFENWIDISMTKIAKELGIYKQDVSKAIKVLEDKEIIIRGEKIGRCYKFRLNPEFGWKGNVVYLDEYREEEWKKRDTKSRKNFIVNAEIEKFSKQFNLPIDELKKWIENSNSK
jgi:hypothetical protein